MLPALSSHKSTENPSTALILPSESLGKTGQGWLDLVLTDSLTAQQRTWIQCFAAHPEVTNSLITLPQINLEDMEKSEWLGLYQILETSKKLASDNIKILIDIFAFDLSDALFRAAWKMPSVVEKITYARTWEKKLSNYPALLSGAYVAWQIQALNKSEVWTRAQITEVAVSTFQQSGFLAKSCQTLVPIQSAAKDPVTLGKHRILQSSVETPYNSFAGVGSVVDSVIRSHRELDVLDVWGFFPLYERDKTSIIMSTLEPYAVIQHFYEGHLVSSTVYRDPVKKLYFVQPDQSYVGRYFDIGPYKGRVYQSSFKGANNQLQKLSSTVFDRSFYLGSSLASFAACSSGSKKIDAVQVDSTFVAGPTFEVLHAMEKAFTSRGYTMPKKVSVLHGPAGYVHVMEPRFMGIGAFKQEDVIAPIMYSAITRSDVVVPVSHQYAKLLLSHDVMISEGICMLADQQLPKIHPIPNGVRADLFDITNPSVMGSCACDNLDDLMGYKTKLKAKLYEEGIIADPALPLIIYVGRYARDKGVAELPSLVKEALAQGAQVVVMGIEADCMKPIHQLIKMTEDSSSPTSKLLRVYTKESDQSRMLCGSKVGLLIRAAADLALCPSYEEPFGLVPIESNILGVPVVLPYSHGFVETMVPANIPDKDGHVHSLETSATAFCYLNPYDTPAAITALQTAFGDYLNLTIAERNKISRHLRENAIKQHNWYDAKTGIGVISRYTDFYQNLLKPMAPTLAAVEQTVQLPTSLKASPEFQRQPKTLNQAIISWLQKVVWSLGIFFAQAVALSSSWYKGYRSFFCIKQIRPLGEGSAIASHQPQMA